MKSIIGGDSGAFEDFYRLTYAQVHAAARRVLWCDDDAHEVVAEVFVFVWRHAPRFAVARGSVTGWLSTIARRRAIDVLRKRTGTVSIDDDRHRGSVMSLTAVISTPEGDAMLEQEAISVHVALRALSPLRQKIIVLAFFRGLTHAEIADSMRMSLGTVKSHVRRGLAAMRGTLEAAPGVPDREAMTRE